MALTLILLMAASPGVEAAGSPGRWNLEVETGHCTLSRRLSEPDGALVQIKSETGIDRYLLTIATSGMRSWPKEGIARGVVRLDGAVIDEEYGGFWPGEDGFKVRYVVGLPGETLARLSGGKEIALVAGRRRTKPIALDGAANAIAALRQCEVDELIEEGADPAQFAPGGKPAKVPAERDLVPQSVMRTIRFPGVPIKPLHYLLLSDTGVVEKCSAAFGIPDSDFEQVVCRYLIGRKVTDPARDPAGRAVRGVIGVKPAMIVTTAVRQLVN